MGGGGLALDREHVGAISHRLRLHRFAPRPESALQRLVWPAAPAEVVRASVEANPLLRLRSERMEVGEKGRGRRRGRGRGEREGNGRVERCDAGGTVRAEGHGRARGGGVESKRGGNTRDVGSQAREGHKGGRRRVKGRVEWPMKEVEMGEAGDVGGYERWRHMPISELGEQLLYV